MSLNTCPCCASSMLLHLSRRRSYWLCPHCRLEMPHQASPAKAKKNKALNFNSAPLKTAVVASKSSKQVTVA